MKKAVVCGLALAACAYMGSSLPATAYAEEQALTVDNFAENEDVFVIGYIKNHTGIMFTRIRNTLNLLAPEAYIQFITTT